MKDVVYCEDCKYQISCYSEVAMVNESQTQTLYKHIEYCSYGERKEE